MIKINILLPPDVKLILNTLKNNNYEAYIVGGCVRDSLLNIKPKDWDIATSALPEETMRIFRETVPTGIKHGTISVLIKGKAYEVTTFRIDGEYSDNRHPDRVIFSDNIIEDLGRRDFTINAMAYNENRLADPFSGQLDLKKRLIRCVGDPSERFKEDALRMLRAIRFSCQLDFSIEPDTLRSISENSLLISNISKERIRDELCKILITQKPSYGIKMLMETKLLSYFLPELDSTISCEMLESCQNTLVLRLAALLYEFEYAKCGTSEQILKKLRFDNHTIKMVCTLLKESKKLHEFKNERELKEIISAVGKKNMHLLFDLEAAAGNYKIEPLKDTIKKIIDSNEPLDTKDLNIDGNDLRKLGYPQGKELGMALNRLLQIVLEHPELNNRNKLIDIVINNFNF